MGRTAQRRRRGDLTLGILDGEVSIPIPIAVEIFMIRLLPWCIDGSEEAAGQLSAPRPKFEHPAPQTAGTISVLPMGNFSPSLNPSQTCNPSLQLHYICPSSEVPPPRI